MAKEKLKKRGAPPKYPWQEWLGNGKRRLKKGKDYQCSTRSLISYLYAVAKANGLKISIHEINDGTLEITPRPPAPFASLLQFAADLPDAPSDLATQHDHYLYGSLKR